MSNRPTTAQLEALVEFLELNTGIARGYIRTTQGKQEAKNKWAELAFHLNALGWVKKDGPGWAKYWAEKKCSLKKLCAQHAASMRQTGGGRGDRLVLTQLDTRLVEVMGGNSFATGDSGVVVHPFPQTHLKETSQPMTSQDLIPRSTNSSLSPLPPSPTAVSTSLDETIPRVPHMKRKNRDDLNSSNKRNEMLTKWDTERNERLKTMDNELFEMRKQYLKKKFKWKEERHKLKMKLLQRKLLLPPE